MFQATQLKVQIKLKNVALDDLDVYTKATPKWWLA